MLNPFQVGDGDDTEGDTFITLLRLAYHAGLPAFEPVVGLDVDLATSAYTFPVVEDVERLDPMFLGSGFPTFPHIVP